MYLNSLVKVVSLFLCLFAFSISSNGQTSILDQKVTVRLSNTPITEALDSVSSLASVKFAYDKKFFRSYKTISKNFRNVKLKDLLRSVLGSELNYELIGKEHVAIFNVEERKKKLEAQRIKTAPKPPRVISQNKRTTRSLSDKEILDLIYQTRSIRDSVRIVNYTINDTSRIVYVDSLQIQLTDTVKVYDTLTINKFLSPRLIPGFYASPTVSFSRVEYTANADTKNEVYGGFSQGYGLEFGYQRNGLIANLGVFFHRSTQNINEIRSTEQVIINHDTLDTFIQIIDNEEVPVHIIDSDTANFIASNDISRTNTLNWVSFPLNIGYSRPVGFFVLGAESGITLSVPVSTDILNTNPASDISLKSQFISWQARLRVGYQLNRKTLVETIAFLQNSLGNVKKASTDPKGSIRQYGAQISLRFEL